MVKHAALNKKSTSSDNPDRAAKGKGRSKATIQRLNMYRSGHAKRDVNGKVIGGSLMMRNQSGGQDVGSVVRIAPDRRWFGNTRTLSQTELDKFREEMTTQAADPYSVILKRNKIPMALLNDAKKTAAMNLLKAETYDDVFGAKSTRKRPKLSAGAIDYSALMESAQQKSQTYDSTAATKDRDATHEGAGGEGYEMRREDVFSKGQSKRIWAELYKVLDSSDVILQVIDARDVPGTRCYHLENHIKKNAAHKHLILIINKCDLVPSWVTRKWVKILSKDFPTLAFHASINKAFGKGALISLLRQFAKLHSDKRQISVGVVGYPNTGKSSLINTLAAKKCCRAAPVPGETKVWQYVALMKRIFLIDCPGVVYDVGDDESALVLKGVVRAERLDNPTDFIPPILARVKPEYVRKQYGLPEWTDAADFVAQLAKKTGKLMKGGEMDLNNVAVSVINDFQRGKLPYFVPPPQREEDESEDENEGDEVDDSAGNEDREEEDGEANGDGADGNEEDDEEDEISITDDDEEEEQEEEEEEEEAPPAQKKGTGAGKGGRPQASKGGSVVSASWEDI